jgi:hypothetical protein
MLKFAYDSFILRVYVANRKRCNERSVRGQETRPELVNVRTLPPPARRTAYRPAIAGISPGFAIRSGYRYNRFQLGQGLNLDVTIYRQDWFELEP